MNETDIDEMNAVQLLSRRYAALERASEHVKYIFIGDIHGDLHQLLDPLVRYGVINIDRTGCVEKVLLNDMLDEYETWMKTAGKQFKCRQVGEFRKAEGLIDSFDAWIPRFTINEPDKWLCDKVVILGDLINEWINSRSVVAIVRRLLMKYCDNVIFIYGNHDMRAVGNFPRFITGEYDLTDIPSMWCTMKKSFVNSNVMIRGNEARLVCESGKMLNGEITASDHVWLYMFPVFWCLHDIYAKRLGRVCYYLNRSDNTADNGANRGIIVSHTFWSGEILKRMVLWKPKYDTEDVLKRNYFNGVSIETSLADYQTINKFIECSKICLNDDAETRTNRRKTLQELDLNKLVDEINRCFYIKPYAFCMKTLLLNNRFVHGINCNGDIGNIILDFIVGHTYPDECCDIHVNIGRDYEQKLNGTVLYTGGCVRFFDFASSAGYNINSISTPRYVVFDGNMFDLISTGRYKFAYENGKYVMIEYDLKNIYDADKRITWM